MSQTVTTDASMHLSPLNRKEDFPAFFALAGVAHAHRRLGIVGG